MFEDLKSRLKTLVRSWIPTSSVTLFNPLAGESYRASDLDVDAVHTALRQAEGGDVRELFAIYRDCLISDPHVQSEFAKRKLAIIGDVSSFLPADKRLAADVEASDRVEQMKEGTRGWLIAGSHLMDSVLWPVSLVEKVYRPVAGGYELAQLIPVPHDLLEFSTGRLMLRRTDANGYPNNETFTPDPRRYIIHRNHLLTTPDHWGGPMRSILFWWLLGAMDRDWWARFLDRYGGAFLLGRYNQGDDQSRTLLERAFSAAVRLGGLVVSKDTDVEIKQAASQSAGEAFEVFYTISRREISKLIVGQTLSAEAQSTGLGSGVATQQSEVRDDYRKFDGQILGETLRDQLFRQFLEINSIRAGVPKISWGTVSTSESKATGEILVSITNAGLRVADSGLDTLSERLGMPIERAPSPLPAAPLALSAVAPLSRLERADASVNAIARAGAADLAQAFRGSLAPIRQMVLDSDSPEDLQKRILQGYSDWPAGKVAEIMEQALIAFAANGIVR